MTPVWTTRGTSAYRRVSLALFLAGFSTFSLLYCVQPLLPEFARHFGLSAAASALALSLTTGFLALAIVVSGAFSQSLDRRWLMFGSMAAAALLNVAASLAPGWSGLLVARALEGLVLGGVPAIAMTYLAEEIDPAHLGKAMGLYVAGTAFGGMIGRVGMGVLTDLTSWRGAMGVIGVIDLVAAIGFVLLLPPSRNFELVRGVGHRARLANWTAHLRNPGLIRLFAIAFALTSVFVTIFNYAGFRLSGAPYGLGQTAISMVFLLYGFGVAASSMAGGLTDRFGPRPVLGAGLALLLVGVALTLVQPLPGVVAGIALVTIGFFIAHSVASGWVGRLAGSAKGHAASLYLLFYYAGSSITGSAGGWAWERGGWAAVAALTAAFAVAGLLLLAGFKSPAREA